MYRVTGLHICSSDFQNLLEHHLVDTLGGYYKVRWLNMQKTAPNHVIEGKIPYRKGLYPVTGERIWSNNPMNLNNVLYYGYCDA